MPCTYQIGHALPCNQPAESAHCAHHAAIRCVSCHAPATHNCTHEKASICGCPLCDECQHFDLPSGGNGQFYQHAKQGQEPNIPHYGKEAMKAR